jgi:hypothetical protein
MAQHFRDCLAIIYSDCEVYGSRGLIISRLLIEPLDGLSIMPRHLSYSVHIAFPENYFQNCRGKYGAPSLNSRFTPRSPSMASNVAMSLGDVTFDSSTCR